MPWPFVPWSLPGNWYSQDGSATSGQSQTTAASADLRISGQATGGQARQAAIASGSDVQIIIGASSSSQSQRSIAVGAPRISGRMFSSQGRQQSVSLGEISISGAGVLSQAQHVSVFGFADPVPINVALKRLIEYPHTAVFDKDPERELAIIISPESAASWAVSGGVMTIAQGGHTRKINLKNVTFTELASELSSYGAIAEYLNPDFASLGAHMLLDGSGDPSHSNSGRLYAYSSTLWALFSAYSVELDLAQFQLVQAIDQMIIGRARGEWLDLWGKLFDHARPQNLKDEPYSQEIPREAFRVRVNAIAIEKAVLELTGHDIVIEEPWENIFRLSESKLSGSSRLYDGDSTGYHIIRPVSKTPIDWTDVLSVIDRNRAAGVQVLQPETRMSIYVDARIKGAVSSARTDYHGTLVPVIADGRLNFMQLSAGSYQRNYKVSISTLNTYSLVAGSPVSASMQTFGVEGATWRDPNTWGEFSWSEGATAPKIIGAEGEYYSSSASYDFDEVEM